MNKGSCGMVNVFFELKKCVWYLCFVDVYLDCGVC